MANQAVSAECLNILWREFLSETESPLNTFLEQCSPKDLNGDTLTIVTPNKFMRDFLKKADRLERILASLKACFNSDSIKIEFVIGQVEANDSNKADLPKENTEEKKSDISKLPPIIKRKETGKEVVQTKSEPKAEIQVQSPIKKDSKNTEWNSNLQENLLFENFVTSSNNSGCHSQSCSSITRRYLQSFVFLFWRRIRENSLN